MTYAEFLQGVSSSELAKIACWVAEKRTTAKASEENFPAPEPSDEDFEMALKLLWRSEEFLEQKIQNRIDFTRKASSAFSDVLERIGTRWFKFEEIIERDLCPGIKESRSLKKAIERDFPLNPDLLPEKHRDKKGFLRGPDEAVDSGYLYEVELDLLNRQRSEKKRKKAKKEDKNVRNHPFPRKRNSSFRAFRVRSAPVQRVRGRDRTSRLPVVAIGSIPYICRHVCFSLRAAPKPVPLRGKSPRSLAMVSVHWDGRKLTKL